MELAHKKAYICMVFVILLLLLLETTKKKKLLHISFIMTTLGMRLFAYFYVFVVVVAVVGIIVAVAVFFPLYSVVFLHDFEITWFLSHSFWNFFNIFHTLSVADGIFVVVVFMVLCVLHSVLF